MPPFLTIHKSLNILKQGIYQPLCHTKMHHRPTPNCVSSPLNVWVSAAGIPGSTQMEEK
jgi:hypothetical protein